VSAGDGRRASARARALVAELPSGPLRSRALTALADQERPVDETLELARQAVEEAGADREAAVQALLVEAIGLALADRYDDALERLIRANELCGPDSDKTLRIKAMAAYARLAALRGEPGALELVREAAALEGDNLIPNAYWGPGTLLGRALLYRDQLDAARPVLERRRERAIEVGDDDSRAAITLHLAEVEIRAGRFDAAVRYAEEGLAVQEASYGDTGQGALRHVRADAAAHIGDVDDARRWGEQALEQCEALGDVAFAAVCRATLGFLELSLGDNAGAVEWLWPVGERFRTSPVIEPGLPHIARVPDAIEALIAVGRLDDAEAILLVWQDAGERLGRPRVRATAARCGALLAAARGDLDSALGHAAAAPQQLGDLPLPLEHARTLIVLGSIQRRFKLKADARASLNEALAILEAIGAPLWAERATGELARVGGRQRAGGLTVTEERVADLVADGRSNKEVAAELFVSVRTVEANLTRIYAKLGIRSRTELAGRRGR
jgi:DNA-binding CsgD family transcriptional regulator